MHRHGTLFKMGCTPPIISMMPALPCCEVSPAARSSKPAVQAAQIRTDIQLVHIQHIKLQQPCGACQVACQVAFQPFRLPFRLLTAAVMHGLRPHHAACQGSCLVKADNTDISGSFQLAGIQHIDSFQPELLRACPQRTNGDC